MLIRLFTSKCAFYVGDSTAKVVNSEQITTPVLYYVHLRNYLLHPRNNDLHKVSQEMLCW